MRALVTNLQFAPFAGSAVVALEVAEELATLGYKVDLCAAYAANPLKSRIAELGFPLWGLDDVPELSNFDLIWSQGQILPALMARTESDISQARIFLVSLSPYVHLEMQGAIADIAVRVVANSHETADHLARFGIPRERIFVFNNAAPDTFSTARKDPPRLNSLIAIANHAPPELEAALGIVAERGVRVTRLGFPFAQDVVSPDRILAHDAVVSIGHSVQYGIQSETPVYVYDRFGGPGWLSLGNAERAAYFNFSGRCCGRRLASVDLANEIMSGHADAASAARSLKMKYCLRFHLPTQISELLSFKHRPSPDRHVVSAARREGFLANFALEYFVKSWDHGNMIADLQFEIRRLRGE